MIHDLARRIDPEAWTPRPDRKWSYFRRRRFASLRAAERCAELIGATRERPPLMIHSIVEGT